MMMPPSIAFLCSLPALAAAFARPSSHHGPSTTTKPFSLHRRRSSFAVASNNNVVSLGMGLLDLSWGSSSSSGTRRRRSGGEKNERRDDDDDDDYYGLEIGDEIGSGSYGTVHLCRRSPQRGGGGGEAPSKNDDDDDIKVAKRAWTEGELLARAQRAAAESETIVDEKNVREGAERCRYYVDVERHCLEKLAASSSCSSSTDDDAKRKYVPNLIGVHRENDNDDDEDEDEGTSSSSSSSREWLAFDLIAPDGGSSGDIPARTLADVLEEDWIDQHPSSSSSSSDDDDDADDDPATQHRHHHLYLLQKAFGMDDVRTFGDVLDVALVELLRATSAVNSANVVHRDVKPGNLLVHSGGGGGTGGGGGSFVLIDFGSAADMDPQSSFAAFGGSGGRVGLDSEGRVALSPIYAAPEVFVKPDRSPLNFDSFSAALVFAQLLFNLLDERADASFRQQLEDCEYDLDSWLARELAAELQPDGMEGAVSYLAERPGVWAVLRDMLRSDPERRASTSEALRRVEGILDGKEGGVAVEGEGADGKFFAEVVELFDQCELPDSGSAIGVVEAEQPAGAAAPAFEETAPTTTMSASLTEGALVTPHPLHYVATFRRSESLGILLSEVSPDGEYDDELGEEDARAWDDATSNASPGEVFVRGTVEGGQAEAIGILGVGDRLNGVGEFPFKAEGFDAVVGMLGAQPPSARTVTLHFGRESVGRAHSYERAAPHRARVEGQGAFQVRGRRKTQEDRFVLHEVRGGDNAALLTGVFDGHGGDAASTSLAQLMPSLLSVELAGIAGEQAAPSTSLTSSTTTTSASADLRVAMESAYDIACRTYRDGCDAEGMCVADYDPREGIVVAGTGASDLVAGSTATLSCLSVAEDGADALVALNCGDSRTLAVGRPRGDRSPKDSVVHFSTRDHSPACDLEMQRLALGRDRGYSQPECSMSKWRLRVGDYQYALARSLEGSFATSKGIVSDPDISTINLSEMLAERELCSIVLASDGLFEVVDNEQTGRYVIQWREGGMSADEVAKKLCGLAVELGSPDNVSVVVLYLS